MRIIKHVFLIVLILFLQILPCFKPFTAGYAISELLIETGVNEFREYYDGEGITIAIIDTVLCKLNNLNCRSTYFIDFVNGYSTCYDDNGHGTEIISIVSSISSKSNYIILKSFNENGSSNMISLSNCFEWIINNANKYNIDIVCMSFGFDYIDTFNLLLEKWINEIVNKDIIVVSSAGNTQARAKNESI